MAAYRIPGIICVTTAEPIDEGTLCLRRSPSPGTICSASYSIPRSEERHWYMMSLLNGISPSLLQASPDAIKLLKGVESLRLEPYDDQTGSDIVRWVAGATIGYGHLIASTEWGRFKNGVEESQADSLFTADIEPYQDAVREHITVNLQQYQYDALLLLAYNIGIPHFGPSSVVKMVNKPTTVTGFASLETAWKAWNTSQGKVMKGLDNRRNCEWKLYTRAVYERW